MSQLSLFSPLVVPKPNSPRRNAVPPSNNSNKYWMLDRLGRIQLSPNFWMREMLYSEVALTEGILNVPDNPELAIYAGTQLANLILEPLYKQFGKILIRSAFRSQAVNAMGAKRSWGCAKNTSNHARHIWDVRDDQGYAGAMACIVVASYLPYWEATGDWLPMAWWIHDNIPEYREVVFFSRDCAFNIGWRENPDLNADKSIYSRLKHPATGKAGILTRPGMDNFEGSHEEYYAHLDLFKPKH